MHPAAWVAACTRWLQGRSPQRPIKGLTRFANALGRVAPYQGVVTLPDGFTMHLDSRQPAERWLLYAGNYQPALTTFLKRHTPPGGTCLDVGANLGFFTLMLARHVGPRGQVVAVEANPALAQRITTDAARNGFSHVTVIEQPIHVRAEPVTFYIASAPGKSSLLAGHVAAPLQTLTLTATTIDAIAQAQHWTRLDVIKLDIEGNDCNALLGARETLARFRPAVVFEYWYTTPPGTARAAFALLDDLGYRVTVLHRDSRQTPFDWRAMCDGRAAIPSSNHHDIVALPGSTASEHN